MSINNICQSMNLEKEVEKKEEISLESEMNDLYIKLKYLNKIDELSTFQLPNGIILSGINFNLIQLTRYIVANPHNIQLIVSKLKKYGLKLTDLLKTCRDDIGLSLNDKINIQFKIYMNFCKIMECFFAFGSYPKLQLAILLNQERIKAEIEESSDYPLELKEKLYAEMDRFRNVLNSYNFVN